jgi:hypothetical protein
MSIPTPLNVNSRSNSNASTPAQQPNTTENNVNYLV